MQLIREIAIHEDYAASEIVSLTLGILLVGDILLAIALAFIRNWNSAAIASVSAIVTGILFFAHLRGWRHAAVVLMIFSSVMVGSALNIVLVNGQASIPLALIFPPVLGLALVSAPWIMMSAIVSSGIYVVRAILSGYLVDPVLIIVYVMLVLIILVARAVLNTEVQRAEEARQRAEAAQARIKEQADALEAANTAQQAQLEEQRRLLDLVATLETPAITLAEGLLFAPVVGHLDGRRSAALTARLLEAAYRQRTNHVIIDIAGVSMVDSTVAQALIQTAQALRLLGCRVTLSGISSEVALTLTQQEIALSDIATVRSPQEALRLRQM
ncbi:STAS domain-containing protein [Roseiflexus sp.]|uniref:STAS domain-containing protein n=1 Tax=Roseiflexus sp. TaxID=2562120 RepID=UPI0025DA9D8A|nr:STAS domain-containing protein [Roseiflexus sp.]